MPCDTRIPAGITIQQRKKQVQDSIAALEAGLRAKSVTVRVGPQGALAFVGAWNRNGVTDVCAYRRLAASGSAELRMAVARAEALAGRKVDARQVAAGTHLHGDDWHSGHK
jgi:hypothetical protein